MRTLLIGLAATAATLAPTGAAAATLGPDAPSCKPKGAETFKNKRWRKADQDRDRVKNGRDRDLDGDRRANARDGDVDGDRKPNGRDLDVDGDRIPNERDADIDADALLNTRDGDMDGDRLKNTADRDMDGDGVQNKVDPDVDGDCLVALRDPDIDGDGIPNFRDDDSDSSGDSVATVPARVSQRVPASFFGLVAEEVFAASGRERQQLLDTVDATGVGTLRQKFDWEQLERAPGVYDFAYYDGYMEDAARRGLEILPILFNPPAFRSSAPAGGAARGTYPPASNDDFARFATVLVRRYGPAGSFWRAHPGLPRKPIHAWQIWNEPHIKAYWPTGPNPAAYAAMLRTVGAAIEAADPAAEVVTAALSDSRIGMSLEDYLDGMYAAGALGTFDTLAIHPYASSADRSYDIVERVRRIMDSKGDTASRIWATEIGWATGGPAEHPFNLGEEAQAELVARVFATLVAQSERLKLRGVVYFNWKDAPPYPGVEDFWGLHTGLLQIDGRPKPAFSRFAGTVQTLIRP